MGVDVGSVRVGVAVCDPDGLIATPLRTVRRDAACVTDTAQVVQEASERGVVEIVVGLPLSMDGLEREAALTARSWATVLSKQLAGQILVRLVDERLSTVDAQRSLHAAGRTARTSRQIIDQQAAAVILQTVLDAERLSGHAPGEIVGGRKPRTRKKKAPAAAEERSK